MKMATDYTLVTAQHIRGARGLLGWTQQKLADESAVSIASIRRVEAADGLPEGNTRTLFKIKNALIQAGITFSSRRGRIDLSLAVASAEVGKYEKSN